MTRREPDPGLRALLDKIAIERGFGCDAYKESCLRRRIAVRMRARGVHTYEEYARELDADRAEYDRLLDALTINVTKFFRNRETWDALTAEVLPGLWAPTGAPPRCWSAGCASGEEAYTLAIVLLERARVVGGRVPPGAIDATDLDRASLERAAAGRYRASAFVEMPAAARARYVTGDDPHELRPEVRAAVRFRRHDLLREPPPAPPYDLVMCRNVVIYFDRPTQERLFLGFIDALRPGGVLVLGKVETLVGAARDGLALLNPRERFYRRP